MEHWAHGVWPHQDSGSVPEVINQWLLVGVYTENGKERARNYSVIFYSVLFCSILFYPLLMYPRLSRPAHPLALDSLWCSRYKPETQTPERRERRSNAVSLACLRPSMPASRCHRLPWRQKECSGRLQS